VATGDAWRRTVARVIGVLAFCLPMVNAATHVVGGRSYSVGRWTRPESIVLPSEAGGIRAEKRVLPVSRQNASPPEKFKLVLVSSPSLTNALLAAECERYVAIEGKIAGLRGNGGTLELVLPNVSAAGNVAENANLLVDKVLEDPREVSADNVVRWTLPTVFGMEMFLPKGSGGPVGDAFVIKTNSFKAGNLVLDLQTVTKRWLQLAIDDEFNIIAVADNGVRRRLLRTGKTPTALKYWSAPMDFPIALPNRRGTVPVCRRFFDTAGTETPQGVIAAWASDGTFWMGPSDCQLALFSKSIVGVKMDGIEKVSLYPSQVHIPTDGEGVLAFERKLEEFDAAILTGGLWQPKTLNLAELFLGSPFPKGMVVKMFSLNCELHRLEITLLTDDPRTRLVIALDTTLSPLSASVVQVRP